MNLQICFMNETSSSTDSCSSSSSGSDTCPKLSKSLTFTNNSSSSYGGNAHPYNSRPLSVNIKKSCSMDKGKHLYILMLLIVPVFNGETKLPVKAHGKMK